MPIPSFERSQRVGRGMAAKLPLALFFALCALVSNAQERIVKGIDAANAISQLVGNIERDYLYGIDESSLLTPCYSALAISPSPPTPRIEALKDAFSKIPERDVGLSAELCARGVASALRLSPRAFVGYSELQAMTGRRFPGSLGTSFRSRADGAVVISTIDESPAQVAGLARGDLLLDIDGRALAGLSDAEVLYSFRGDVGSNAAVRFLHKGSGETRSVNIRRAVVTKPLVRSHLLEGGWGYLAIGAMQEFGYHAVVEQLQALRKKHGQKLSGLVIDLRTNQGGILEAAAGTASLFLKVGEPVVEIRGRNDAVLKKLRANDLSLPRPRVIATDFATELKEMPLAVLVSESTASGAEAFAAALQDANRAVIVGAKTAGAGVVQNAMPIVGRVMVMIATSQMHRPSGSAIYGNGVLPDQAIEYPPSPDGLGSDFGSLDNAPTNLHLDPAIVRALASFNAKVAPALRP